MSMHIHNTCMRAHVLYEFMWILWSFVWSLVNFMHSFANLCYCCAYLCVQNAASEAINTLTIVLPVRSDTNKRLGWSSIDLTLSNECYEINASFLSSSKTVRENLKDVAINKIDLNEKFLFKKYNWS